MSHGGTKAQRMQNVFSEGNLNFHRGEKELNEFRRDKIYLKNNARIAAGIIHYKIIH